MAFTGQLGSPTSQPGNVELGLGPSRAPPGSFVPSTALLGTQNSEPGNLLLGVLPFAVLPRPPALTGSIGTLNSTLGFGTMMPGDPSSDIGSSQARQIENLGNSPAGQTGYATGSSGNTYGATSDKSTLSGNDALSRPAKRFSQFSPTGVSTVVNPKEEAVTPKSTTDSHDQKSFSEQQRPTTRKP